MKKIILALLIFVGSWQQSFAKEGMWIPYLLEKINASDMQAMGMHITAKDIYDVNQASLKDAIVFFGRGCTGEIVSDKGLLLTNHHCGYGQIQKHSTIDHDYLTDGFWAMSKEEELINPKLSARILTSMADVTEAALNGVDANMSQNERNAIIAKNIKVIKENLKPTKFHRVDVRPFYNGNQYILMEYDVYFDVRLVGAPPSNIGKFGGDTDNWMWPRHTGDFSIFRIYANAENKACDIADNNVPYKPKQHLKISLNGYNEGDFTFIFGYPGRTQEYIPAKQVEYITQTMNPFKIDLRRKKLDIMSNAMENDKNIRIQYSAKYAGVANRWKKWIGENKGIKANKAVAKKQEMEANFTKWANDGHKEYATVLNDYNKLIAEQTPYEMAYTYFIEAGYYHDLTNYSYSYSRLVADAKNEKVSDEDFDKTLKAYIAGTESFYKDYNTTVDLNIFKAVVTAYKDFPYMNVSLPLFINTINKKYKGDASKYAEYVYSKSLFTSKDKIKNFLENSNRKKIAKLDKDPMYIHSIGVYYNFIDNIRPTLGSFTNRTDSLQRIYMKALLEFNTGKTLAADANSTLRIAYGKVEAFVPRDGVKYNYYTTLSGIIEKENPDIYDYVVMPKLKTLYNDKDFGKYGDKDGSMHVCFIASNHTTGGNSGSPALNADGDLIGLNFDRNWEGTMSDLNYDISRCRNIMLDIRYCLFIIDKYAGAGHLVEEMTFVQKATKAVETTDK